MPFKDYLTEARITEAEQQFSFALLEAINGRLAKTVAVLGARGDDDDSDAGVDIAQLADLVTAVKVVGNRDMRQSITKNDVGYDPNSVPDLYDVMNKVPDSPKTSIPRDPGDFYKKVAALVPKIRKQETEELGHLTDKDPAVREKALQKLKAFSIKVDQLFNKLKTAKAA